MKKILIFHLFAFRGFTNSDFTKIHEMCLKNYIHIFDESRFVVVVDNLSDSAAISEAFNWVLGITNGRKFSIKIKPNTELFEVDTFKEEILDNVDVLRDYVFFAHLKGITENTSVPRYERNSVLRWTCGLYYFSLNFIDEVTARFSGHTRASEMFYGPFVTVYNDPSVSPMLRMNHNNCFYQGTFYWINMRKFSNYLKEGLIKLPEIDDRYWVEMLPGVICGRECYGDGIASHMDVAITNEFNFYAMNDEEWKFLSKILKEPDFMTFSDKILETIKK